MTVSWERPLSTIKADSLLTRRAVLGWSKWDRREETMAGSGGEGLSAGCLVLLPVEDHKAGAKDWNWCQGGDRKPLQKEGWGCKTHL